MLPQLLRRVFQIDLVLRWAAMWPFWVSMLDGSRRSPLLRRHRVGQRAEAQELDGLRRLIDERVFWYSDNVLRAGAPRRAGVYFLGVEAKAIVAKNRVELLCFFVCLKHCEQIFCVYLSIADDEVNVRGVPASHEPSAYEPQASTRRLIVGSNHRNRSPESAKMPYRWFFLDR